MPNIKSAKKRLRQSIKRNAYNNSIKSELKTIAKRFDKVVEAKEKEKAQLELNLYYKKMDKAVGHGVVKKNTAARRKSAAAKLIAALTAQPAETAAPKAATTA